MTDHPPLGVMLTHGPQDWQVIQQRPDGTAAIHLAGTHVLPEPAKDKPHVVYARIVDEATYEPIDRHHTWTPATMEGTTWSLVFPRVPAGGRYRIETCIHAPGIGQELEWSVRGDMVHHVGVGDVWIIAGQSNAAGYGKTPVHDPPDMAVSSFRAAGHWALAAHPLGDSTSSRYTPNRERANASHSPFLAFAKHLSQSLGYPIGLVPTALGGSALAAWNRQESGVLFENMLAYIRDAKVGCDPDAPSVRGMCWYQGESDCGPEPRLTYLDRFRVVVDDLRQATGVADLPVVTVQLNRLVTTARSNTIAHEGWDVIREAQRQAARTIPGVTVVPAHDLNISDVIHTDSAGNLVLGQRMAAAARASAYGQDVGYPYPDLADVALVEPTVLELRFDHVYERLIYVNLMDELWPLAVHDTGGPVPIAKVSVSDRDTLRVELSRPFTGPGRVVGMPSGYPPFESPIDGLGHRPMLGFSVEIDWRSYPSPR